jgi:hypothetical protein
MRLKSRCTVLTSTAWLAPLRPTERAILLGGSAAPPSRFSDETMHAFWVCARMIMAPRFTVPWVARLGDSSTATAIRLSGWPVPVTTALP